MEDYKKSGSWKDLFSIKNSPFLVLFVVFTLLPIFFIPSTLVSLEFSKAVFLSLGLVLAFALAVVNVLKNGAISFPRGLLFWSLLLIVIVYLISSLTSGVRVVSLIGYGFEVTTFATIFSLVVLVFLVGAFFHPSKRLFSAYVAFFVVALLMAIFHIFRIFFGVNFLSLGYFPNIISNTLGKWNEIAVFFGGSLILSILALEMLRLPKKFHIGAWFTFILSLLMIIVVNLPLVWYATGAISLLIFVYLLAFNEARKGTLNVTSADSQETKMKISGRTISIKSLVVVLLAFFFVFTPLGVDMSAKISEKYGINNIEVRPSWSATWDIGKQILKTDPFFGSGPNKFAEKWQLYRPDVNQTNFWNINFDRGIGFIPTTIIETGILGLIAWLAFFFFFLLFGFRLLFGGTGDRFSRYFAVSSFITALYFWIMNIIYTPNLSLLTLAFFFTGFSIAAAHDRGLSNHRTISIFKFRRLNFVVSTIFVVILVAGLWFGYIMVEKILAFSYYSKASILAANKDNLDATANNLLRAIKLVPNDVYYRAVASINVTRLSNIIASTAGEKTVSQEVINEFTNVRDSAITAALYARTWNPENFQNWLSLAGVYETIAQTGIAGSAEGTRAAYDEAIKRSPRNPAIYLSLARFETSLNNLPKAKESATKSLELKSNYLEAIFLLSQIDAAQGNIAASAVNVEKLSNVFPNDPSVAFRLGILKYELKDYGGAASAFERAVKSVPVYANARYFLGLSYQKLGRNSDAIAQFEELEKTNPDSAEVKLILGNLRAGNDPFAAVKKPLDNKPEKRKKLPVEEKSN